MPPSFFEKDGFLLVRAGKRPALVTKQFALQQLGRYRRAIHRRRRGRSADSWWIRRDEPCPSPRAHRVQSTARGRAGPEPARERALPISATPSARPATNSSFSRPGYGAGPARARKAP